MDIKKYTAFFHDGIIHNIKYFNNEIILELESAELLPEWNKDKIILSERNTISGKLHLENYGNIWINGKVFKEKLVKNYDSSDIYDFEIHHNKVLLFVSWINYPLKKREETPHYKYEIEAEKIYLENLPNLFDEHWRK